MAIYDLTADAAFAVLRWRSQELNIKLHVVAQTLVETLPKILMASARRGPPSITI